MLILLLTSKGFFFTWSSRGGGVGDRKSRIDNLTGGVIVNNKWQDGFAKSDAVFAALGGLCSLPHLCYYFT